MAKTTKKTVSPAYIATAIFVECPMQPQRCRAGYVFKQGESKRIELSALTSEQLDILTEDPYLKISYEADETLDTGTIEARILELEAIILDKDTRIKQLEDLNIESDKQKLTCEEQTAELKTALEAKEAEIAELKTAAKAKK